VGARLGWVRNVAAAAPSGCLRSGWARETTSPVVGTGGSFRGLWQGMRRRGGYRVPRTARSRRVREADAAGNGLFPGFAATSLDDIAATAGITRVLPYRHFDSKTDLYRAVLDRAIARLTAAVGTRDYTYASIDALLGAAAEDPDGFRLLFHHAAREPEFRRQMDRFRKGMVASARRELARVIGDRAWAQRAFSLPRWSPLRR
jgi:AcrR family transcriptional regulator